MKALKNQDGLNQLLAIQFGQCVINNGLEWNRFACSHTNISGKDAFGLCSTDALSQGFAAKACKDDRVDGTDASTGEHGHGQFRNHGHVNGHHIAFSNALRFQSVCDLTGLAKQLLIGKRLGVGWFVPFPNQGNIIGIIWIHVTIDGVVTNVQLASNEKSNISVFKRSLHRLLKRWEPVNEVRRSLGPVFARVGNWCFIIHLVAIHGMFTFWFVH